MGRSGELQTAAISSIAIARLSSPALLAAATAGTAHAGPALCAWSPRLRRALGVRDSTTDRRAVALTFDDGPHWHGTPAVLEALREAGATATFFLVGEQVERRPALAAEIADAGHEIGVHGHRHRNLLRLTPGQVADDLRRGVERIAHATGREPRLYRPPYGVLSAPALAHARRLGWEPVLWTRWGRDWRARATAQTVTADAAGDLRGGEVVLLHDADFYSAPGSWRATAAALPRILEAIAAAGLRPGAVR
ncbi:MAG: polysaccharide deacetylase family protein [Solirubrobacteraceae bacterium]